MNCTKKQERTSNEYYTTLFILKTQKFPTKFNNFLVCWLKQNPTEKGLIDVEAFKKGVKPALRPILFYNHAFKLIDKIIAQNKAKVDKIKYGK